MNVASPPSMPASLTHTSGRFRFNVDCTSRCVMDGLIGTAVDRSEATVAPLPWTKCGLSYNGDCTLDAHRQQHTR